MGNAPVRQVRIKPSDEAITALCTILDETQLVCQVLVKGTTYFRLKRILQRISQHGPPNILTRSLLVANLYFNDLILGQWSATDFVHDAMHDAGVPSSLTSTPYGMSFVDRVVKPAYDSLRLLCLNRGRQKECIDAIILKDWGLLQQEAKAIDYHYNEEALEQQQTSNSSVSRKMSARFHATNWIIAETLSLMEGSISLGVEAKLFQAEIDAAFWYRDFLISTQLNVMTAWRNIKEEKAKMVKALEEEQRRLVKKKKGKKANNGTKQIVSNMPSAMECEDNVEYVYTSVKRTLCRGIFRFIMVLKQAKFLDSDVEYQFTSKETIINKRFESFQCVDQPALLTYDDFVQGSDFSRVDPDDLISAAAECFDTTKGLIDQLNKSLELIQSECAPFDKSEVMMLKKVCVGNSIFLHKVRTFLKYPNVKVNVEYDFVHKQFCIIKVVEVTRP
uniref:NAA35-like TPR repeats domain-containing protein n=1 Tax=Leptocylindrus danicus TaxID=163516 RepID=A0A6U2L823_9STRA